MKRGTVFLKRGMGVELGDSLVGEWLFFGTWFSVPVVFCMVESAEWVVDVA